MGHLMTCHVWTWKAWMVILFCYYFIVQILESHVIPLKFFIACFIKLWTLWDSFYSTLFCCVNHKDEAKRKPDLSYGLQLARANHCTTLHQ